MPAPPVNPTRPSTSRVLRCVRWLKRAIVYQWIGWNHASWQPPLFEDLQDLGADRRRADGVQQDLHLHAVLRALGEGARELEPHLAVPVDVGLDRHRPPCVPDRVEHRRVELVAVVQHGHVIAVHERGAGGAGHTLDERLGADRHLVLEAVEGWAFDRRGDPRRGRHQPQPCCVAPFAVDRCPDGGPGPQPPGEQRPADSRPQRSARPTACGVCGDVGRPAPAGAAIAAARCAAGNGAVGFSGAAAVELWLVEATDTGAFVGQSSSLAAEFSRRTQPTACSTVAPNRLHHRCHRPPYAFLARKLPHIAGRPNTLEDRQHG